MERKNINQNVNNKNNCNFTKKKWSSDLKQNSPSSNWNRAFLVMAYRTWSFKLWLTLGQAAAKHKRRLEKLPIALHSWKSLFLWQPSQVSCMIKLICWSISVSKNWSMLSIEEEEEEEAILNTSLETLFTSPQSVCKWNVCLLFEPKRDCELSLSFSLSLPLSHPPQLMMVLEQSCACLC